MKIKNPKRRSFREQKKFFNKKYPNIINQLNEKIEKKIAKPPDDGIYSYLYNLYNYLKLNKRLIILEFGSGWSSLIFIIALNELYKQNIKLVTKLKINKPFELYILENSRKYLNISRKRIQKYFKNSKIKNFCKIHYLYSEVYMSKFKNKIVTEYKKLPLCNPDFIYLDGPDQFNVKGEINGFSTRHKNLMPMVSDLLKIEYYLIPGTIILVDGRAANARFLKDHFVRNWKYKYNKNSDFHTFVLSEKPLGKLNSKLLKFYKKK